MRNLSGQDPEVWLGRVSSAIARKIPTFFRSFPYKQDFSGRLFSPVENGADNLPLDSDSRVAVIGSGPAGSFFSHFLLCMADRLDLDVHVDIYDPRDFSAIGPTGCNMCGGIISESLVQMLAAEGISLPANVVQRGIDAYVLHTDLGNVRIDTPLHEKRIAAIHRGTGPRDIDVNQVNWFSFDRYLQDLAVARGARVVRDRVDSLAWRDGRPQIKTRAGALQNYDLVAVAVGVNSASLKIFQNLIPTYQPPVTTKTFICEYKLGEKNVAAYFGDSMHVYLLNLPRLEFAAIIPKGEYVTVCLLGEEIDAPLIKSFLESPAVRQSFPPEVSPEIPPCHCSPRINTCAAVQPFGDRFVFIGDSGVTRLFKDGIGAAYRTAKAAAEAALFHGVSCESFKRHYWPVCREIDVDNKIGKAIFAWTRLVQRQPHDIRGLLRMVAREQRAKAGNQRMSMVLWDLFTGSAPYREIVKRAMHPSFVGSLLWNVLAANLTSKRAKSL